MKGILLFVHNTGGSRLVLRYPPILRGKVSAETMKQFELRDSPEPEDSVEVWDDPYAMPSVNLVGFIPVRDGLLLNKPFEVHVNNTAFLGHPMSIEREQEEEEEEDEEEEGPSEKTEEAIKLGSFNLVVAFSSKSLSKAQIELLRKSMYQLSCVIKREELRTSYLARECQTLFKVRDNWLRSQSLPPEERPGHAALSESLMACSTLAKELRHAYEGLSENGFSFVRVNNWVAVSMSINVTPPYPTYPLRPFQAMLITNRSTILPPDSSPDLLRFVQSCKPSKSFQDMQMELNLPLAQIYRMAAHLLYWRIGKVVSTMKTQNVYCINPKCNITEDLVEQFSADFSDLSLLDQLKRFSTAKPVKEHLTEITISHKLFSEVLVWFLRKEMVIQLFTFLLLSIPTTGSRSNQERDTEPSDQEKNALSEQELEHIEQIAEEQTPMDQLFVRLCHYARGRHHIDEIVWRENILFEDVEEVLSNPKYQCIVTFQTESEQVNF